MKKFLTLTIIALSFASLLISPPAHSDFRGTISYTNSEREEHLEGLTVIIDEARKCMSEQLRLQQEFFKRYGVARFYGTNSDFSRMTMSERRSSLARMGVNPDLASKMEPTSCVGMAMMCLEKGFKAANQIHLWQPLKTYTLKNGTDGTALQKGLRELGWKVYYWNPDPSKNKQWDLDEKESNPENRNSYWGYHDMRYKNVLRKKSYYYVTVDDATTLVGFKHRTPEFLKQVPLFVGTAHAGYHVFPGFGTRVIEAHSTRRINDPKTIESAIFNPLDENGAPAGVYRSGLIAVPPVLLPTSFVDQESSRRSTPNQNQSNRRYRTDRESSSRSNIWRDNAFESTGQ